MKMHVIAIRDIKADCFGQPNFVASIGSAIRSFGDQCQKEEPNNILYAHPEDFELYLLGEYDDSNATFELGEKKQLAVGSNYGRQR